MGVVICYACEEDGHVARCCQDTGGKYQGIVRHACGQLQGLFQKNESQSQYKVKTLFVFHVERVNTKPEDVTLHRQREKATKTCF